VTKIAAKSGRMIQTKPRSPAPKNNYPFFKKTKITKDCSEEREYDTGEALITCSKK
jgi:hypothetical protein